MRSSAVTFEQGFPEDLLELAATTSIYASLSRKLAVEKTQSVSPSVQSLLLFFEGKVESPRDAHAGGV